MARRYIDITLDKPRHLRFDVNALDDLERALGNLSLGDIYLQLRAISIRVMRIVLWAGLRHEDRNVTPDRAGVLMQDFFDAGGEYLDLMQLLTTAIEASGVVKGEEAPAPPADPPTTG